jgi:ABC-2 type transport system ATP-binding protein
MSEIISTVPSDDPLAVEATGLTKEFGSTRAVDGVDLLVPTGSVYGVLGPNGAGKTTTIKMLATLVRPTSGVARVLGHDVVHDADAVRARISLTGQLASVDADLTGRENLVLLARLSGHSRAAARDRALGLLDSFGLSEAAGRLVKRYSGGMRRRLDIAASIIDTPDLLFLDEPTTGLDPRSRNEVWETVRALAAAGTTVLLTTQNLEEADQLADRIAVIDHGRVIAEGTPDELKSSVGAGVLRLRLGSPGQRPAAERVLAEVIGTPVVSGGTDPASLAVRVDDDHDESSGARAATALEALARKGIRVTEFALGRPSLDEVFLTLTGRPAADRAQGVTDPEPEVAA